MKTAHIDTGRVSSPRNRATVTDYRGARVRTTIDTDLTVLTISGEIDASNVDDLSRHALGLIPEGGALIVDLAGIDFIAVDGLHALFALYTQCASADTTWTLITNHEANRLLRVGDHEKLLPAVGSATEALRLVRHHRRPERSRRRRDALVTG